MRNAGLRTKIPFFVRRLPMGAKHKENVMKQLTSDFFFGFFDVGGRLDLKKVIICCWKMELAKKHVRSKEVSTSEAVKNQFFIVFFNLYPSASTSHIGRWSESPYQTIMSQEFCVFSSQIDWCCIPPMVWSSLSWAYLEQKTAMIICNQTGMVWLNCIWIKQW